MKHTTRFLEAARGIWEAYLEHPFVKGIADGSLDKDKFCYYMLQDYVYLIEYARVFALGVAKAEDMASMRYFAAYVGQILDGEMNIHRAYMERLGIRQEEAEEVRPALANSSYTSYMLQLAYKEGPASIAASILACALSYEYIARRILEEHPQADQHPFFGEWISGYADPGYHEANEQLIALTEALTEHASEKELQHLEDIFVECSRYEMAFWDMGWEMSR